MDRTRKSLVAFALIGVIALVGLLFFLNEPSRRADRTAAQRAAEIDQAANPSSAGAVSGERIADKERIAAFIRRLGGFAGKGSITLTLPEAPGAGLDVRLRTEIDGWTVLGEVVSESDGSFAFPPLPRGDYVLTVESERTKPYRLEAVIDQAEHDFGELTVDRYYFVVGRVTGEGGLHLKGAEAALVTQVGMGQFSWLQSARDADKHEPVAARAETDGDGKFTIRLERPGLFTLRVSADGFAPHYKTGVVVDARNPETHDITLTRGDHIVGFVYDGTGNPVADAAVALYAFRGFMMSGGKEIQRTDGAGRFEFRVEAYQNRYMVRVVPPEGIDVVKMVNLPVRDDLIVRLPGTGVIKGRIVDADTGQGVPGAEVLVGTMAQQGRSWWPDYSKPVTTDEYGGYAVKGVGGGFVHSISVKAGGFMQARLSAMRPSDPVLWGQLQKVKLEDATENTLPDIPLRKGRILTGTILDKETRRPIPGAEVEMTDWVMGGSTTVADDNGVYKFAGIGDQANLRVAAEGYATFQDGGWQGWRVPDGSGEIVRRDIELAPGAIVEGRVRAKDGKPLVGALVRLETTETGRRAWQARMRLQPFYTYTDKEGAFRFSGVPPMKLKATAELQSYTASESKARDVKAGDTVSKVDIEMVGAATYEGRVVARGGKPVTGAHVTIAKDPGASADRWAQWRALADGESTYTDANGRFLIDGVPTGDILIRVEAAEYATSLTKHAAVKPGETISGKRIELSPAFVITGKVLGPDGKPMAQAWVSVTQTSAPDGEPSPQTSGSRLETDGSFNVRNLGAGLYRIEVRTWGGGDNNRGPRYKPLVREGISAGTKDLVLQLELAEG